MPEPIPPGRAGRLRILERLTTARRGEALLDRKRQLLQNELTRLARIREQERLRWLEACTVAELWGLRAATLGGRADLSLIAGEGEAAVELTWRNSMGVRHPEKARCSFPAVAPLDLAAGSAAIAPALPALQAALEAAAASAVAERAYRSIEEELAATRRRVRALRRRVIEVLEEALRILELRLDEIDREERFVTRWVRDRRR